VPATCPMRRLAGILEGAGMANRLFAMVDRVRGGDHLVALGRLSGPRCVRGQHGAGRVRLGAWCGITTKPTRQNLPEANRGPVWVSRARKSEREPGTPKASGWFDNRTQKITPERFGSPDIRQILTCGFQTAAHRPVAR